METFSLLEKEIKKFVEKRNWDIFHNPKDLAISISIEAAELLENFQWKKENEVKKLLKDSEYKHKISQEIADIFIYLIILSNKIGISLLESAFQKIEKNKEKYPVEKL
ncbi:MAG: nucleotide pyrophosphohydrolase [Thermoplasmata archaeon]|nr:MAG: nucleotide pyrophosphohydrolase [Thermoplasmata archaeon]